MQDRDPQDDRQRLEERLAHLERSLAEVSDEAVSRLVRQRSDTRYRTALDTFNRLFAATT